MNNKQLYLSEKMYKKETEVKIDRINYDKWCRILYIPTDANHLHGKTEPLSQ